MFDMYRDRRKDVRAVINAPGKIVRLNGLHLAKTIRCTVVNISEAGALIRAEAPIADQEFYLELDSESSNLRLCSVLRRLHNSNYLGVRFVTSAGKYE
jgi:c-di-GMP-binding flagellar brake protein YcgR